MMRNDYRRSLILLRSGAEGYSGHVRLERRTLMGSMYFMVQAPPGADGLQAALVGRGKDSYYACPLGELRRDGRGLAVLSYSFDPRSICGRELEKYQLIVVAREDGEDCGILLSGNICGHAELNWERVRQAVCLGLREGQAPRAAIPAQEEGTREEAGQMEASPEAGGGEAEAAEPVQESAAPEEAQENDAAPATAGELLGIDMSLPWPEAVEPLRSLFAASPPVGDAPDTDYVYISAPMPAGSGYDSCLAGIRVSEGAPFSVRYALPSVWTTEPPAGLEDAIWAGDGNAGWWVVELVV